MCIGGKIVKCACTINRHLRVGAEYQNNVIQTLPFKVLFDLREHPHMTSDFRLGR